MSDFGQQWGSMSSDEKKKAKDKYGSRKAWKEAKNKSKNHQSNNSSKSYTDTANGRIEAPSWYKNLDGSTPSTMQSNVTEDKWNASLDRARAEKEKSKEKQNQAEMINTFSQNAAKTGKYGEDWKGFTANMSQKTKNNIQKQIRANVDEIKSDNIHTRIDANKEVRDAVGPSVYKYQTAKERFASNKESGDSYLVAGDDDQYEDYSEGMNEAHESIASKLLQSGHDFSWEDYNMHKNGGAQNSRYNYEPYGGYDNWYNNHSLYGANGFTGSKNVLSTEEVGRIETGRTKAAREYRLSDRFMDKYGKYDWAKGYYNKNINSPYRDN